MRLILVWAILLILVMGCSTSSPVDGGILPLAACNGETNLLSFTRKGWKDPGKYVENKFKDWRALNPNSRICSYHETLNASGSVIRIVITYQ